MYTTCGSRERKKHDEKDTNTMAKKLAAVAVALLGLGMLAGCDWDTRG